MLFAKLGMSEIARKLGVTLQTVINWRNREVVPFAMAIKLERIFPSALHAGLNYEGYSASSNFKVPPYSEVVKEYSFPKKIEQYILSGE